MADVELTQVSLGLRPYVLIEANADPDSPEGVLLEVQAGGGAGGMVHALPVLMLAGIRENNPITREMEVMISNGTGDTETLCTLADRLGVPRPS